MNQSEVLPVVMNDISRTNIFKLSERLFVFLSMVLIHGMAFGVGAVTWQSAKVPASSLDVSTNGSSILAVYWSDKTNNLFINGTVFINSAVMPTQNGITATLGGSIWSSGSSGFYDGGHPVSGADAANYASLLGGASWSGVSAGSITVTLSGLTVGHQYEVQVWAYDDRASIATRTETLNGSASDISIQTLARGVTMLGRSGIGTFTPDSTSQVFTVTDSSASGPQINALQLRDLSVPIAPWQPPATLPPRAVVWQNARRWLAAAM